MGILSPSEIFTKHGDKMIFKNPILSPSCPWNINKKVDLPVCENNTKILGSYNRGQDASEWDKDFWDRMYMSERQLSDLERDGIRCKTPCSKVMIEVEPTYLEKNRQVYSQFLSFSNTGIFRSIAKYAKEFGDDEQWDFAIRFVYKNLEQGML